MLRKVIMSMGSTVRASQFRMARMAGKSDGPAKKHEDLGADPEYKSFKSVDQMQKGKKDDKSNSWMYKEHRTASDEINHRGIDQRAKEWNVPVEKVEQLKQWETAEAPSHLKEFKKTVLGANAKVDSANKGSNSASQQHGSFYDGGKFNELASKAPKSDKQEMAADRKDTNSDSTRAQVKESNATKGTKLSANDEINHRGIDQRAKEWGVPADKLEKLKPWEHQPSESNPELYKKTILKDKKEEHLKRGFQAGSARASEQHGADGKVAADIKYTDKAQGENDYQKGKKSTVDASQAQVKNAQNTSENFDQGMVDKAMSWVKDKLGAPESNGKQGPTADHNALNKGYENHRDSVHKATFTEYKDSTKPFTSSTKEPKKSDKKDTLNH